MPLRICLLTAIAALAVAAPASADSIAYTKNDNVWLTTPDGTYQRQVTTDGAQGAYQAPGQVDDGTIVVARPGARFFYALRPDGTLRNSPLLAPGNSCGTGPLDLDVTPQGAGQIVFQYVHSDFCFGGSGPRSRVTFAFSDGPTGSATFPKHDNWTAPRWTPGTEYASMVAIGGGSIGIQGGGTVSPWLATDVSVEQIKSFDISRSGNRVLVETVPAGSSNGPSRLVLWQNDGVPKSIDNTGHVVCQADAIAAGDADPRWSPDGSQIAWEGADGIYVSPAPVANGGACVLQPKLVVPGGNDPAWGAASLTPPGNGGGSGGDGGSGGQNGGNNGNGGDGGAGGDTGNGGNGGDQPPADRSAPTIVLGKATKVRLATALRKGYAVRLTLSEAARVTGTLTLGSARGKASIAGATKVASGTASSAGGATTVTLKFTAKAKKRLRKAKSARLTLQVVAVDGAGNQGRATPRKVVLKR